MMKRRWIRRAMWVLGGACLLFVGVAAWYAVPILTHVSGGSSGQDVADGDAFSDSVTAQGDDGRTRTLQVTDESGGAIDLSSVPSGAHVIVSGSGYNSSVGIYVALCAIPASAVEKPTPCMGGAAQPSASGASDTAWPTSAWINGDAKWRLFGAQAWSGDGAFTVKLALDASDSGLDCRATACAIYTRADHTAMNDRVQDMHLPVKFSD